MPSDDILLRLLGATEEIRDLLRQKANQENSMWSFHQLMRRSFLTLDTAQKSDEASHQSDDAPPEADATTQKSIINKTENVVTDNEGE